MTTPEPTYPADIEDAASRALHAALRDSRVGFAIKASTLGGAYAAFHDAVCAALMAEREMIPK